MRHGRESALRRFDGHKLDVIIDEASELAVKVLTDAGLPGWIVGHFGAVTQETPTHAHQQPRLASA